jgi:NADPH:quinone reductase-like Zn-dependent oxidoreductase
VDAPGGFEKLRVCDLARSPLGASELRVRTESIGVNFADCVVRMGLYESAK